MSSDALANLSRFNAIMGNIYALDNGLRILNYSLLIFVEFNKNAASKVGDAPSIVNGFLLALVTKIADARVVNRFFGLPATIEGLFAWGDDQSVEALIGKGMTWSMMAYFPLEHLWYLSSLKPTIFNVDSGAMSMWSCRSWTLYVLLDIIGTIRKINDVKTKIDAMSGDEKKEAGRLHFQLKCLVIWLSICIFGDLPLALQWFVLSFIILFFVFPILAYHNVLSHS